MNKILKFLICSTFLGTNLNAENNFSNYLDNDHRIRNFSFMGPFPKNFNGDSLIIAETKKNIDFKEIDYLRRVNDLITIKDYEINRALEENTNYVLYLDSKLWYVDNN